MKTITIKLNEKLYRKLLTHVDDNIEEYIIESIKDKLATNDSLNSEKHEKTTKKIVKDYSKQ